MAWRRDTSTTKIGGSSLYAYTEVDWHVGATQCTYTHIGGCTSPYGGWSTNPTATLWWGEWNGSDYTWHEYASGSAHYTGSGDKELVRKDDYFTRTSVDRYIRLDCDVYASTSTGSGTGSAWLDYTVPALPPSAPDTLMLTYGTNYAMNLSWTNKSGVYESIRIERQVNSGAWSPIATLPPTATSWTDTSTSYGYAFRYRLRYYNQNAYGSYVTSLYGTPPPFAPSDIQTSAIANSTDVQVSLTNTASTASGIEWQVSYDDGSTWEPADPSANRIAATPIEDVFFEPVSSFVASGITGTALIRVRNYIDDDVDLYSDWKISENVTTICPPAAPTLLSPTGVLNMSEGSVTFSWLHNAIDGSAQTAVLIRYSTDNGSTWTSTMLNPKSGNTYTITPIPWAAGTTVTWQAKTKGADPNYGEYASAKQFTVCQVPTLSFVADNPPTTVSTLPIPIEVTYTDPQGMACAAAYYQLYEGSRLVASEDMEINGGTLTQSITANEFLPVNGQTYTLTVTARSGSSLSASVSVSFDVDYVPPKQADLSITNDPDTGYASLLVKGMEDESVKGEVEPFEWNQLRISYYAPQTVATNVQIAESGGGITLNGTAAANAWPRLNNYDANMHLVSGHVYASLMDVSGGAAQIEPYVDASQFGTRHDIGTVGTCTGSGILSIQARLGSGTSYNGSIVYKIGFYDLTAIFGSGNEPTTVDAFKATTEYQTMLQKGKLYDYDSGSTQHTMIDLPTQEGDYIHSVAFEGDAERVVGKNLANLAGIDRVQLGLTISSNGSEASINGTSTGDWAASLATYIPAKPSTSYAFSISDKPSDLFNGMYLSFMFVDSSKANISEVLFCTWAAANDVLSKTYTSPANAAFFKITVGARYASTATNKTFTVQMEQGSTATAYEPYFDPYVLTTTGQGTVSGGSITHQALNLSTDSETYADILEGNWLAGINDVHDEYADGVITRRIGCVDLGSLTWTYNSTQVAFRSMLTGCKDNTNASAIPNLITGRFHSDSYNSVTQASGPDNTVGYFTSGTTHYLAIKSTGYGTDPAAFKTAMSGVLLYYELATPVEVSVSEIAFQELEVPDTVSLNAYLPTELTVGYGQGLTEYDSISIYRVTDHRQLLAEDVSDGFSVVDRYAPLNTDYAYEVITYASSGAFAVHVVDNRIESERWFAYWGDDLAWAKWNPTGNYAITRPEKKRVHYAGRKWALSYDSKAQDQVQSISWTTVPLEDWENGFVKLMDDGGRGVYKGCDGWVYHADFDYSSAPEYTSVHSIGQVSLTITRIDGESL